MPDDSTGRGDVLCSWAELLAAERDLCAVGRGDVDPEGAGAGTARSLEERVGDIDGALRGGAAVTAGESIQSIANGPKR